MTLTRRGLLAGGAATCLARGALAQDRAAQAREVITKTTTVDMHSHAGGFISPRTSGRYSPVAEPMRRGGLSVACLAVVSDSPTHRVTEDRRIRPFRDPAPGELYGWTQAAFRRLHDLITEQDLSIVTDVPSLGAARAGHPAVIVAAEGADFLEGRAERVDEAYERWHLRHLQLTHYRPNELGDIQTEAVVHGGLTEFGAEVIRRCNRRGIVVDVAHGTYDLVKKAAVVTEKPLILSHTALSSRPNSFSRLISPDHAKAVAGTGGVIGVWPPTFMFSDLAAMVNGMARLAEAVGVDHVGFGSDMQGLPGGTLFDSYAQLPLVAEALLTAGFGPEEAGKILGGNYRRVFETTAG